MQKDTNIQRQPGNLVRIAPFNITIDFSTRVQGLPSFLGFQRGLIEWTGPDNTGTTQNSPTEWSDP